jgi:hypothetical protein
VIEVAYIVAGLFEIAGVAWVVADVRMNRRRAREMAAMRFGHTGIPFGPIGRGWIYEAMDDEEVRRNPTGATAYRIAKRRRGQARADLNRIARRSALADLAFRDALVDLLGGNLFWRLGGPACLVIGIALGTVANIANTH